MKVDELRVVSVVASSVVLTSFAGDGTVLEWKIGDGVSFGETSVMSVEASASFDSKYLSYGLVDNNEPIVTPGVSATVFDCFSVGVESIFDVTKYGRKRDADGESLYANRGGRYQELDPSIGVCHSFTDDDADWLPTTVDLSLDYSYEYHPRHYATGGDDTQFVTLGATLPDLWLEPSFTYERDIVRDNGTYLNLELGHTFEVCDGVTVRPSVAQGFGNAQRVKGYMAGGDGEPIDHAGLMDTLVKCELSYEVADGVACSVYGAYSDYVFDRTLRHGARAYEASGDWTDSWNFIGGFSVAVSF